MRADEHLIRAFQALAVDDFPQPSLERCLDRRERNAGSRPTREPRQRPCWLLVTEAKQAPRRAIRALSASEIDAEDVLVANEKQDCRDSSYPRSSAIDLDRGLLH